MKRTLKWLLPVSALVGVVLVRSGWLDLGQAVLLVAALEVLLLIFAGSLTLSAVRKYRDSRGSGFCGALADGLGVWLPRPVAHLLVTELRLLYCLLQWVLRRVQPGMREFSYHGRSMFGSVVLMIVLVTPIEVVMVEVLLLAFLPLLWLRVLVFLLEVYVVFWVVGFYASRIVLPHRLEDAGLRLHHGVFAGAFIPYSDIKLAKEVRRRSPDWSDGLQVAGCGAYLAIGGRTDVTLELRRPGSVHGFLRPTAPVSVVHLAVDEPKSFVEELRRELRSPAPGKTEPAKV